MGTVQHCALKLEIGSARVLSAIFVKRQTCFRKKTSSRFHISVFSFLFSFLFFKRIAKRAITRKKQVLMSWGKKNKKTSFQNCK
jgi:hypothetical protein